MNNQSPIQLNGDNSEEWKVQLRDAIKKRLFYNDNLIASQIYEAYLGSVYLNHAPRYIYKYYPDKIERFSNIEKNTMWYSAPFNFNDPFDADFQVDRKAVFDGLVSQVREEEIVRVGSQQWRKIQKETTESIRQMKEAIASTRMTVGVSCFSESDESLLMWAHYAHNHRGICVEYELMRFNSELGFSPVPVIYSNLRPCLRYINIRNQNKDALDFFIEGLTTKSPEWSYEREWRVIRDKGACGEAWDNTNHGAVLPSITPSSIILGCDASGDFASRVKKYCETHKVNLFMMEKDETEYSLIKNSVLRFE